MKSDLLDTLNDKQQAAVSAPCSHHLILAGAGSGKTRVLVHRIAWLLETQGVSPYSILAVTFTNKAAQEMRLRIERLRNMPSIGMWVGTFHGLANRFLRAHYTEAGLPESFQILDSDDQYRMVRRVMRSLELDESKWQPKQAQWFINKCKEEGRRPGNVPSSGADYFTEVMAKIYTAYEDVCRRSGLVDFAELLLRCLETLQQTPELLQHYQNRFSHILVDEFQDTNTIQYAWLKTLTGIDTAVMAVGDDDQSIYSWRGAKVENLERFVREYPNCQTIRLEQNYRSTQNILDAANTVIANNPNRMGKELWSNGVSGELIKCYCAFNEQDEAYYLVSMISQLKEAGFDYTDMAILYRSNAQSRVIEEQLLKAKKPYRIYGGQKFFERAEIKDALAYLRLLANRHDDAAFERVVNLPTRGIGNTTMIALRSKARDSQLSLWQCAQESIKLQVMTPRAAKSLQAFLQLIEQMDEKTAHMTLNDQTEHVLQHSLLLAHYQKDKTEKGLSKVENLEELISATNGFNAGEDAADLPPLAAFLSHVALEAGDTQADVSTDSVNLMTLHSAKGLEFKVVFLTGLEENLFPHKMSLDEGGGLEEERRLCYVGMTRAREQLYITYAQARRLHGMENYHKPSRFIDEIPEELIHHIRPKAKVARTGYDNRYSSQTSYQQRKSNSLAGEPIEGLDFKLGQRVRHSKFGEGVILSYEGKGAHTRVQINFQQVGTKWLVASFAKLEAVTK